MPRIAQDFYATPEWVTRALLSRERIDGTVWEPACGNGAIARLLPGRVYATDIVDRGYADAVFDFLDNSSVDSFWLRNSLFGRPEWIVTNPPYKFAEAFVRQSCSLAQNVALLLKLNFLEGQKRYRLFQELKPHTVYVLSRRPSFDDGNAERPRDAGLLAYAWFVWKANAEHRATALDWIL